MHLPPRARQDLLLPARRPGLPHLPSQGRAPGHRQRRRLGQERSAGSELPHTSALRDRGLLPRPRIHRTAQVSFRIIPASTEDPLRVVLVGAGGMGRRWLATVIASPEVELVGIADLDLGAARAAAVDAGLPDLPVGADAVGLARETS